MRARSAFTLVELLVVVSIIALLISVLLPALSPGSYAKEPGANSNPANRYDVWRKGAFRGFANR